MLGIGIHRRSVPAFNEHFIGVIAATENNVLYLCLQGGVCNAHESYLLGSDSHFDHFPGVSAESFVTRQVTLSEQGRLTCQAPDKSIPSTLACKTLDVPRNSDTNW